MAHIIEATLYSNVRDPGKRGFIDLAEAASRTLNVPKKEAPGWSPGLFEGGRTKKHIRGISAVVFDLDKLAPSDWAGIRKRVEGFAWGLVAHATASDAPDLRSWRIIIPLSGQILPEQLKDLRNAIGDALGIPNDPGAEAETQLFFYPVGATPREFFELPHPPLDPGRALAWAANRSRVPGGTATRDAARAGAPLAGAGGRHAAIRDLVHFLCRSPKFDDPGQVMAALGLSLQRMVLARPDDPGFTWAEVHADIERQWELGTADRAAAVNALRDSHSAANGVIALETSLVRWGDRVFYQAPDGFGLVEAPSKEHAEYAERQRLGKFVSGRQLWMNAKVPRAMKAEIGRGPTRVVDGVLIEGLCPLRPLEPAFDPRVDRWLRALAGPDYPTLEAWLAWLPSTDASLPLLFCWGPPGIGKSLLANGLAALWAGPTGDVGRAGDLREALGGFNEALTRCPLVVSDEQIDLDAEGSAQLRSLVSSPTHNLNAKNIRVRNVEGFARAAVFANNRQGLGLSPFAFREPADLHAVAERILAIEARPEAREVLEGMSPAERHELQTGPIARHVLWLQRERKPPHAPGRTAVAGNARPLLERLLATREEAVVAVLGWVVQVLSTRRLWQASPKRDLLQVRGGAVWLSPLALRDKQLWEAYSPEKRPPNSRITQVLHKIAAGEPAGGMWPLSTELLAEQAADAGLTLSEILAPWTEDAPSTQAAPS